ncbi:MAG TPA: glycosyltransferase family 2 protein [Candidatus Xenobia bacterium]|nr:glycosyltransferase family 2 protein [Candidatus Xenobia bacterium]
MGCSGSIVIVTFNSAAHIEACLQSVRSSGWEVIVVDNGSTDDSVARARAFPDLVVLTNSQNRGFAAAANQGVKAARGDWVLLLNPDAAAEPGALDALTSVASEVNAEAAGGRLLNPDGTTQVGFTLRRLPRLPDMLAEVLLLNRVFPRNPWNRRYRCLDMSCEVAAEVEQPAGACLLVKRQVWEELGGMDESFFPLWFEDVDFCRRLRQRGGRIVYAPQARFRHRGAHSVKSLPAAERQLAWYRNLLRYFRKHHGLVAAAILRLGIVAGALLRLLATAIGARPETGTRAEAIHACAGVVRWSLLGETTATAVRA